MSKGVYTLQNPFLLRAISMSTSFLIEVDNSYELSVTYLYCHLLLLLIYVNAIYLNYLFSFPKLPLDFQNIFHVVIEVPRWTNAKMEVFYYFPGHAVHY